MRGRIHWRDIDAKSALATAATALGALGILELLAFAPSSSWLSLRAWLLQASVTSLVLVPVCCLAITLALLSQVAGRRVSAADVALSLAAGASGAVHGWGLIVNRIDAIAPWLSATVGLLVLGSSIALGSFLILRLLARLGMTRAQVLLFFVAVLAVPLLAAAAVSTEISAADRHGLRGALAIGAAATLFLVIAGTFWGGRRRSLIVAASIVLAVAVLRTGTHNRHDWRVLEKAGAFRAHGPPVLLVVLDTFRADALDLSDPDRSRTPNMARLARESSAYPRAVANASWTLPGHASIFTGRYLFQHRTDATPEPGFNVQLNAKIPTAHELFGKAGYRTACIAANNLVGPRTGLIRGCQRYRNPGSGWMESLMPLKLTKFLWPDRFFLGGQLIVDLLGVNYNASGQEVVDIALDELKDPSESFYLFLNFMDVHLPLSPSSRVPWSRRIPFIVDHALMLSGARHLDLGALMRTHAPILRDYYAAQAAQLDRALGRLLDGLRERGIYDRTLIVLTADHGHAFSENETLPSYFNHQGAYEPVVRVPLLVKLPDQRTGAILEDVVQQVDVLPTLLSIARLPPPQGIAGRPLAPGSDPLILTEWYPRLNGREGSLPYPRSATYDGAFKYVRENGGREYLYDLDQGPYESADVIAERPALAARLRAQLTAFQSDARPGSERSNDDQVMEQLRSLGYIR